MQLRVDRLSPCGQLVGANEYEPRTPWKMAALGKRHANG